MNNNHPSIGNIIANSKSPQSTQSSLISSEISSLLPIDFSIKHTLLCPDCHIRIPLITKIVNENDSDIKIAFQCLCSNNINKEMSLFDYFLFLSKASAANKPIALCKEHNVSMNNCYCTDCEEWLCVFCYKMHQLKFKYHLTTNKEVSLYQYCLKHKDKLLTHYCKQCSIEICEICSNDYHANHQSIRSSQYIKDKSNEIPFKTETDAFYFFNTKVAYCTNIKDKRIEEIKGMINQLNTIVKEIEEEYNLNLIKNIYLLGLIEIVYSNIFNQEKIPNINSMTNALYLQNAFEVKPVDFSNYENIKKSLYDNIAKIAQDTNEVLQKRDVLFKSQEAQFDAQELTLTGHTDWVKCLVQISDNQVVSCSYDKTIKVWNLAQEKSTKTLKGHKDWIRKIIYLDKNIIASCSDDTTIKVWNISLDEHIVSVQAHNKAVYNIIKLKHSSSSSSSSNSSSNGTGTGAGNTNGNNPILVASASEDLSIKIWNVMKKELLFVLEGHSGIVSTLDQLDDGRIVSGSWDKLIRIWNLNKSHCDNILSGHSKYVHCVIAIAPETIASGSEDKLIKIWDTKTSKCINTLIGHIDGVLHLIKLQDSRLVSSSMDKTIKFWNTTQETALLSINAHCYSVRYIIQLKDGKLVSCSDDLTVKVWY